MDTKPSPDEGGKPRKYYYVSVVDDVSGRHALLCGPYTDYQAAKDNLLPATNRCCSEYPISHFFRFGTCGSDEEFKTKYGLSA